MKRLVGFMLLAAILVLTGCVIYDESMELNKDGSGKYTFGMGVTEFSSLVDTEEFLEDEPEEEIDLSEYPGITIIETNNYIDTETDIEWTNITLEFETLEALANALNTNELFQIGEISFSKGEDGYMLFKRTIPLLADHVEDFEGTDPAMLAMFLGEYHWNYKTKLPGRIVDSNAAEEDIDRATNTISWSFPFIDLIYGDQEMWAKIAL